ncbi:MAG: HPr-rel-A system PqqD family peptide chaperone [Sphingomonadaceae bacterium]
MSDPLYSSGAAEAYQVTPLDALTAIYHRVSGMTHIVGDPVPQIVAALHGQAMSVTALLAALASDHGLIVDEDTTAALQARLDELLATGLIYTV